MRDHVTSLYPQKLALTSLTGGGRSVGIVRSRTKATELACCYCNVSAYFYVPILALHETEVLMAGNVNLIVFMGVVLCGLASGLCRFEAAYWCIQNRRSLSLVIAGCCKASLHACPAAQHCIIDSFVLVSFIINIIV